MNAETMAIMTNVINLKANEKETDGNQN